MQRRNLVKLGVLGSLATLTGGAVMASGKSSFKVAEMSVAQLQAAMQSGKVSAQQLVQAYTARIAAIDRAGPKLRSVIEMNPEASAIAAALDEERRRQGPRGPLHDWHWSYPDTAPSTTSTS